MRRILLTLFLASPAFAADADHDLTLKVKSAIAAEPALKNVSVMVSVMDGVAVLGGPVSNKDVATALSKTVKAVPGVTDVRVNTWVQAGEDPLNAAVKSKLNPPVVKATPVALLPLALPATSEGASAYSPVPPPAPPPPPGPSEHPTIISPKVPVTPGQNVAMAVEAVRKSDVRFDGLVLSVNAGVVTIAANGEDAWALATAVRRVPGVDKVVVGKK